MNDAPNAFSTENSTSAEVTLMDVWLVVCAHKILAIVVVSAFAAAGIVVAFTLPPQYRFTTTIEIGSHRFGDEIVPIETPKTVVAKLKSSYFPSAISRMTDSEAGRPGHYEFDVSKFDESLIVEITSEDVREGADSQIRLHEHVVDALLQDHNRVTNIARENVALVVETAESEIILLEAEARAAADQEKILGTATTAAKKQLVGTVKRIAQLEGRFSTLQADSNAAEKISTLLLSQQIEALMTREFELGEKVDVSLPIAQSNVQARLVSAIQKKKIAQRAIKYQEAVGENIRMTSVLGGRAAISVRPVTPNKTTVILISLIVGAAVAIGSALAMSFLSKAQRVARP